MSEDREGPTPGAILGGIFLILFGLCLLLAGGTCTIMWISLLLDPRWGGAGAVMRDELERRVGLLVLSLFIAGLGVLCIVQGVRLLRGPKRPVD